MKFNSTGRYSFLPELVCVKLFGLCEQIEKNLKKKKKI